MPPVKTVLFRDDFTDPTLAGWDVVEGRRLPAKPGTPPGPDAFGTGEQQTYRASNIATGDGLRITPTREGGQWFSGRIELTRSFKPAVGQVVRFEARITLPDIHGAEAAGYWPAFWALGSPYAEDHACWPQCGEVDILEAINGLPKIFQTLHAGHWTRDTGSENLIGAGKFYEPEGISTGGTATPDGSDPWGSAHVYAFEWDRTGAEELRWSVDGEVTQTLHASDFRRLTWWAAFGHDGYYPVLNVAMGGAFPDAFGGSTTGATLPGAAMVVDYVEVSSFGEPAADPVDPPPIEQPDGPAPVDPQTGDVVQRLVDACEAVTAAPLTREQTYRAVGALRVTEDRLTSP